jgi:short-subunit dehydrogenase
MNIFIAGATSAMAQAWARLRAAQGDSFYLLARDSDKLTAVKEDLLARGARTVTTQTADLAQPQSYEELITAVYAQWPQVDIAFFAQGSMPAQSALENAVATVDRMFALNVQSYIQPATLFAQRMATAGTGSVVLISSPAGDRGRQSNYFYGASKAAVTVFASGLRNRFAKNGVQVLTVKPGFVDTPMTAAMDKTGPLWATPARVAACIEKAIQKKKDVIYAPWFWQYIMLVIHHIPERIFKKLSL